MITHGSNPDMEQVRQSDLDFHLGSREDYDLYAMRQACRAYPIDDVDFFCFQKSPPEVFAGELLRKFCRFGDKEIEFDLALKPGKLHRTLRTVNRDYFLMADDVPFAFAFRDRRTNDYARIFHTKSPIPVYQYHRHRSMKAIIHPLKGYHEYPAKNIPPTRDTVPLSEKKPRVFWRGNLAGVTETSRGEMSFLSVVSDEELGTEEKQEILRKSLRYTLSERSFNDDRLDVGLVLARKETDSPRSFAVSNVSRPRATIAEHFDHRYLLTLDGYDGPSSWYWMLNSNSVVIRQKSDWLMFGDSYFIPWVHYVPMADDGSDLTDVFDWCERNLGACEKISRNARAAWAVLFDEGYQAERRRNIMSEYRQWFGKP